VTSSDVGNMGGRIAVAGVSHLLCHHDIGIIGNHAKSQLMPAVISVEMSIFDLGFFIEFLAELEGTVGKKMVSNNKKKKGKRLNFEHTLPMEFFLILCVEFIYKP
jgi:hypothetical protein